MTDPYGSVSGFLDRSRYYFFQVAPRLHTYEAKWTPFQTHYFSENLVAPGIETRASGFAARNSGHQTTEAVYFLLHNKYKFSSYLTGNTIHLSSVGRNPDH
jgi:hypothetical protein